MTRLRVENLEGRELLAAGVLAGITPAPVGSHVAAVTGQAEGWVGVGAEAQANGIIAILIGVRAPTQPTTDSPRAANSTICFKDMLVSSFQGGCNGSRDDGATQALLTLPYIEQDDYSTPFEW